MGLLKKYKMILTIALLMVVEAAVLFYALPSRSTMSGKTRAGASENADEESGVELAEFKVGEGFKVHNRTDPVTPLRIEFDIYLAVGKEVEEEFQQVFDAKQQRIREAIQTVMRNATDAEINEEGWRTLKRKLKEAVDQVVGPDKPYVKDVILPRFLPVPLP
jgi:flagellar basal body-associated protein FliL